MFRRIIAARPVAAARLSARPLPRVAAVPHHHQQQPRLLLQRRCSSTYRDPPFRGVRGGSSTRNLLVIIIATALTSSAIGAAAYALYMYYQLVEKPLSVYPPAAAAQVKEALYHASRGDAARMATAFKEAIRYAEESGMHPLSNEVAGLKIECAQLLLNIRDGELAGKAVAVLERVLDENVAGAEYFAQQGRWADRTNVLKRAVLLGYKIGEIYQQLGKDPDAEEAMAWSTETLLKEVSRREDRRADAANEGDWFDDVAMSACFEKLARQYDRTSQHYLATPLYLKAITLVPPNSCHTITLMNNLAASLARQQPLATAKEGKQAADLLHDAQRWAQKALDIDSTVKPPVRTDECDHACVAATHTLGEIARLLGDRDTAQRRFDEARSLAHGLGMTEGIQAADEGLKNVEKMPQ